MLIERGSSLILLTAMTTILVDYRYALILPQSNDFDWMFGIDVSVFPKLVQSSINSKANEFIESIN